MQCRILQGAENRRAEHVPCDANDEQFAKSSVEYKFRRHPAVAAPKYRDVGLLALGKIRQDFALNHRKVRLAVDKTLVAPLQTGKRLVGGAYRFVSRCSGHELPGITRWNRRSVGRGNATTAQLANDRPETGPPRESRLAGDIRLVVASLEWPLSGIDLCFSLALPKQP